MIDPEQLGRRIALFRKTARLSQEKLGREAGLSRMAISSAENGRTILRASNLAAIAEALDVTVDDLIGPTEHRGPKTVKITVIIEVDGQKEEIRVLDL